MPARRAAITGAYACCNFWMINASSGALIGDTAGNFSDRFGPFLRRWLTVHAHGMLNEAALKSGAAMNAIPALAEFVKNNGIHGVLADYEPLDATMEHAQVRLTSTFSLAIHFLIQILQVLVRSRTSWPSVRRAFRAMRGIW